MFRTKTIYMFALNVIKIKFMWSTAKIKSKQKFSSKQAQCVPIFGCKLTLAEFFERLSSLVYFFLSYRKLFTTCYIFKYTCDFVFNFEDEQDKKMCLHKLHTLY